MFQSCTKNTPHTRQLTILSPVWGSHVPRPSAAAAWVFGRFERLPVHGTSLPPLPDPCWLSGPLLRFLFPHPLSRAQTLEPRHGGNPGPSLSRSKAVPGAPICLIFTVASPLDSRMTVLRVSKPYFHPSGFPQTTQQNQTTFLSAGHSTHRAARPAGADPHHCSRHPQPHPWPMLTSWKTLSDVGTRALGHTAEPPRHLSNFSRSGNEPPAPTRQA